MIVRWQSGQVNTKEGILSIFDKAYHTNKKKVTKDDDIKVFGSLYCVDFHDPKIL